MQIDKAKIIDLLKSAGEQEKAGKAQSELPDKVDTDQHSDLLSQLGINLPELLGGLGGVGKLLG